MAGKLLKSTFVVSFMTLLSRISGLVRDVVFARYFGADALTDAFFVAFKIPNLLRRQFAEGAFSQAFVPVFTEYKTTREHEEVKELAADVTGTLGIVLFCVTVIGVIAAPILVVIFAPGWVSGDERFPLTVEMLRFTFPYILFISLTALAGGILNSYGKFAIPAFTPVLLNICLIVAAVISASYFNNNIIVLAWGVFAAGLAQLLFQLPFVMKLRLASWPRWAWRKPGVDKIKKLMLPAIFSSSLQQINLVIDYWVASFLVTGSISWLYYADRLVEFPLGVFGIAIATVILPSLSAKFAGADPARFRHTLDWGLRLSLLIGAPATVGLVMLAGPLLSAIFQYGDFDLEDVRMAQLALIAYSIGLLGFIYVKVLSPGYFARQDTTTPMKIAVKSMVFKITLTLVLVISMMKLSYDAPHVGLALSTAISALLQSWLLYRGLVRDGVYKPDPGWLLFLVKTGLACAVMALVLYYGVENVATWTTWSAYKRAFNVLLWVGIGAAVYLFVLVITGVKIKEIIRHT
ncbi:MAG: murein biosynthesis integral membrane protein MurJ [Gammaproteobacteria bacterium]|nr:murein biosynthesis integral membrane protein MurJ [Gammaproteobacteria bacterium]